MSKKNVIRGRFRLYPGQDDDLITWWKSLDDLPYGGKGQAIKEALRNGLGFSEQGRDTSDPTHPSTHAQTAELLLDIRRVVEAAVTEVLNQGHVEVRRESETSAENRDPDDTARVDELMAEMQRNLLLPEDEDDL
ncbi:MAG: hypothetical protein ISS57_10150 [Anaerolineales bacterium]|nr:hypothetical protein [Anaerolineales bacterium]